MPFFAVTYTDGTVEVDECQDNGARYLTIVRYRIPFVTTVYTEIVRRLDQYAVTGGNLYRVPQKDSNRSVRSRGHTPRPSQVTV
jgi:hypothetical protein